MKDTISINQLTCKKCILCTEVCPNKILIKNESGEIVFRPDRVDLCFKCGQCMAVCSTRSITVDGLSYKTDFFELPQNGSNDYEKCFMT